MSVEEFHYICFKTFLSKILHYDKDFKNFNINWVRWFLCKISCGWNGNFRDKYIGLYTKSAKNLCVHPNVCIVI